MKDSVFPFGQKECSFNWAVSPVCPLKVNVGLLQHPFAINVSFFGLVLVLQKIANELLVPDLFTLLWTPTSQ